MEKKCFSCQKKPASYIAKWKINFDTELKGICTDCYNQVKHFNTVTRGFRPF